jgi:hypothetical protein
VVFAAQGSKHPSEFFGGQHAHNESSSSSYILIYVTWYGTVGGGRIIVDSEIRYRMVDCSRCIIVEVIARRPNLLRVDTLVVETCVGLYLRMLVLVYVCHVT